jgi:hypothetical protein
MDKAYEEARQRLINALDPELYDVPALVDAFGSAVENRLINQLMMSGALSDTR